MQLEENILFANRYRLERLLGRGGFSEVWLADDTLTSLKIALKVYAPGSGMDEQGVQLFSSEFSLVFNLNHSNLLKPTYYDTFERMPYLVLPYYELGSAANLIGKITEKEAWIFLRDLSTGLEYLHEQEPPVIHQDIKPDNVLVDASGRFLLTDFGISIKARNTLRKSIMKTEGSVGTLAYMGPERFSKYPLPIKASDIFSLGATLYELLSGMVPFGEHGGLLLQHGAEIPVLEGEWSDALKKIIDLCLRKDTWERPTAAEVRIYSEQFMKGETPVLPGKPTEATPLVEEPPLAEELNSVEPSVEKQTPSEENNPVEYLIDESTSTDEGASVNESTPTNEDAPAVSSLEDDPSGLGGFSFPKIPAKLIRWGASALFLIGLIAVIAYSFDQKQKAEEVEAKTMEIESRYAEYLQYIHDGDSLVNLGNGSQGDDYELFYLGAIGRYEAAERLEEQYRSDFPEVAGASSKKESTLQKIDEIYHLFASTAGDAEQNQDYEMAEIFYKRAAGVKQDSAILDAFHSRRDSVGTSVPEQIEN